MLDTVADKKIQLPWLLRILPVLKNSSESEAPVEAGKDQQIKIKAIISVLLLFLLERLGEWSNW